MATEQLTLNLDQAQEEIWKPIPGYEGLYEVSDRGRVRGLISRPGFSRKNPRLLIPRNGGGHRHDYKIVKLSKNGMNKHKLVHRLVMLAFAGPCLNGKQVHHKDFNPGNNHLENLEYCASDDHAHHSISNYKRRAEHGRARLTEDNVVQIRELLAQGIRQTVIAKRFGVDQTTVSAIKYGKTWTAIG